MTEDVVSTEDWPISDKTKLRKLKNKIKIFSSRVGNGVNYFQPINMVKTENNKYLKILLSPGCLCKQVPFISDLTYSIMVQNYLPLPKCFCAILCFPEEISKH